MPTVRKAQGASAHFRISLIHLLPSWPVISAATAKANGTVMPTKPRYKATGWMTIQ